MQKNQNTELIALKVIFVFCRQHLEYFNSTNQAIFIIRIDDYFIHYFVPLFKQINCVSDHPAHLLAMIFGDTNSGNIS